MSASDQSVVSTSVYVASRASVPERPAMWQSLRANGWNITSTWIDESGEGETGDFAELWERIGREIAIADGLILYAKGGDFPLKGALVEVGIAIGLGKPVGIVIEDCKPEPRSLRPLGSWASHPLCKFCDTIEAAREFVSRSC